MDGGRLQYNDNTIDGLIDLSSENQLDPIPRYRNTPCNTFLFHPRLAPRCRDCHR